MCRYVQLSVCSHYVLLCGHFYLCVSWELQTGTQRFTCPVLRAFISSLVVWAPEHFKDNREKRDDWKLLKYVNGRIEMLKSVNNFTFFPLSEFYTLSWKTKCVLGWMNNSGNCHISLPAQQPVESTLRGSEQWSQLQGRTWEIPS